MADGTLEMNSNDIFAENVSITKTNETSTPHTEEAGKTAKKEEGGIFQELLGELGDHHELTIGPYHVAELPIIFYDNGLHVYSSPQSMEKEGLYTTVEGKIQSKADHHTPALDLSVTNLVVFQWISILIILVVFGIAGRKAKKNKDKAPNGLQNAVEYMVDMVRHKIVKPNVPNAKVVDYLFPYFVSLYFFILVMNFLGLFPGGHTATGALSVTGALAITAYFVINLTSIREIGLVNWLKHLTGGAPIWLAPIMIPIEILSMFTKPFALTIRLFANMTAGHVVLLSLVGLIFFFTKTIGLTAGIAITPISVAFSIFMLLLETLVALLQAYIFTILTAVFVGLAIGEHEHAAEH